ncbi:hypothetical protein HUU53_00080 [Candidatus Micrarchaeota archaeon]|nr:hypothetical protein [Candidatus Micrarchaeota archaeon]
MNKYLLSLILVVGLVAANIQVTNYQIEPTLLQPGLSGTLTVTFENVGIASDSNIQVQSSGAFVRTQTDSLGTLGVNQKGTIKIPFTISGNAQEGTSQAFLKVSYSTTDSKTGFETKTFSIPFIISEQKPVFDYSIIPSQKEVSSGDEFSFDLSISNSGSDVKNVVLKTTSASQVELNENEVFLGSIASGTTLTRNIKVKVKSGIKTNYYEVPLLIQYELVNGKTTEQTLKTEPVLITPPQELEVKLLQEKKLSIGTKGVVNAWIYNKASETIENVAVILEYNSSSIVALENTEKIITSIRPGEKILVPFNIAVKSDSFITFQPSTLRVAYNHNGLAKTIELDTALEIGGDSGLNVTLSSDKPLTAGALYTLSFKVFNSGNTPIRALTINVEGKEFDLVSEKQSYIGTLNLDDEATIDKQMYLKPGTQPGTYYLNVLAYYKDSLNEEKILEIPVEYQVLTPQVAALTQPQGTDGTILVIGLIVLAGLGYFGYKRFFKKKQAK